MAAWTVYILTCCDGSYYTGSTTDLVRRLREHQTGQGARYTRSRLPCRLVWSRKCRNRATAQRLEARLKALPRAEKTTLIHRGRNAF